MSQALFQVMEIQYKNNNNNTNTEVPSLRILHSRRELDNKNMR